jgi:hypothetical protein
VHDPMKVWPISLCTIVSGQEVKVRHSSIFSADRKAAGEGRKRTGTKEGDTEKESMWTKGEHSGEEPDGR